MSLDDWGAEDAATASANEVGRYRVKRLLGRGACGEVFLVKGPRGLMYAMKTIPCDVEDKDECEDGEGGESSEGIQSRASEAAAKAREAAIAEAKLLQGLRHPHVVGCEEVFFDAERQAVRLVLEYMDGGDLDRLIARQRDTRNGALFDAHLTRRVLAAIGGALNYVHGLGVLHRDVKPANMLLSKRSNRIKLADFGIAKLVETTTLRAKSVLGTPYYLSPEIVCGETYGAQADGWALGACLYEVAALKRPFQAGNQLALVRKICDEAPPELPEGTASDLKIAIEGLLEKNPSRRMVLSVALQVSPAVSALVTPASAASSPSLPAMSLSPGAIGGVFNASGAIASGVAGALPSFPPSPASAGTLTPVPTSPAARERTLLAPELELEPLVEEPCFSAAAVAARAALGAEIDDPEELQLALVALQRELEPGASGAPAGSGGEACDDASAAALDSLNQELQLRLGALRDEAAALLDGLLENATEDVPQPAELDHTQSPPLTVRTQVECGEAEVLTRAVTEADLASPRSNASARESNRSAGSGVSTPRGEGPEDVLEVATTLGVDTEPVEERLASLRRMLSVRVVWGELVRFCLLPMRVTFDALMRHVSSRFGLAGGCSGAPKIPCGAGGNAQSMVQLVWCEAGETFPLNSQATWEECLQRRGLANQPGRLELQVRGIPPTQNRRALPRRPCSFQGPESSAASKAAAADDGSAHIGGVGFVVTGTQAFPGSLSSNRASGAARAGGGPRQSGGGQIRRGSGRSTAAGAGGTAPGRSWAAAPGREQPIHWAPTLGTAAAASTSHDLASVSGGLDLSLAGTAAKTHQR